MSDNQPRLRIVNPRPEWVKKEFTKLLAEWEAWEKEVAGTEDHPIPEGTDNEIFKDGKGNMRKHASLQAKTKVFLDNNVEGHNFIRGFNGNHIDRTDLRLRQRVEHRLDDLHELNGAMVYALVPEGYWREKAKEVIDGIAKKGPDAAIEIVASYLKNPGLPAAPHQAAADVTRAPSEASRKPAK